MITIIAEVVEFNQIEGTESLSYKVWEREKAINLANKIHTEKKTHDIIWVHA